MSSTLVKYRVHEVAKDFKMNSKDVAQILTDYATTPKNHMQVLEDDELDIIFEYLTQHNQMDDLSEVFVVPEKPVQAAEPEAVKAPEAPVAVPVSGAAAPQPAQMQQNRPVTQQPQRPVDNRPHIPRAVPEKRVIDTSGVTVNIEKYDDRLSNLVPEKAENMQGKEKFLNKNKNRQALILSLTVFHAVITSF